MKRPEPPHIPHICMYISELGWELDWELDWGAKLLVLLKSTIEGSLFGLSLLPEQEVKIVIVATISNVIITFSDFIFWGGKN
ncbi:MAG: hypothetical protein IKY13_02205 [Bacteroidaceae bacterium]|nr:hypothetical protein [Bacteroidaceae bacterium]